MQNNIDYVLVSDSTCDLPPEIVSEIGPTAEIVERIRPVYNFKAAE